MQLYLIRHAQSANNHAYATGGERQPDPPLTELGHHQARALADYLRQRPGSDRSSYAEWHGRGGIVLTHLYTSLMLRAVTTAAYIAVATDLPLHAWTEIHEVGGLHGIDPETGEVIGVPGPGRAYFAAEHPTLVLPDTLTDVGWWNRDKEPREEWQPRAEAVWRDLLVRHGGDDRVALVTHGGFFRSLFNVLVDAHQDRSSLLGLKGWWIAMNNAAITRIDLDEEEGGRWAGIAYVNKVDHLTDDLLSY
ncbi:MAG: histidine phosphatase family protein [Candidatus Promineofilum sp.]|nr:histidine phosphatase family protein [Promineifilum sp.]MCW5862061.1 histidine phosphatase family protein [Anaerolineae bacterium]